MDNAYQVPGWFRLDVAGQIFPAARTRHWNCTFREAFLLKEDVELPRLRQALEDVQKRFPSFFVGVRGGLFWYYLQRTDNLDIIMPETTYPCRSINIFSPSKPALRVYYDRRRVSVELSHFVADGGAALVFLKALLVRYLELGGLEIPQGSGLPDIKEPPRPGELADSYLEYYTKHAEKPDKLPFAYQYRPPHIMNYLHLIHGTIPLADILPLARAQKLTLTEYLASVYLYAFYLGDPKCRKSRKPVQISVPISLRNIYPTETLRNFSAMCRVGFYPRKKTTYTFEDMMACVRGKVAQAQKKENVHKFLCQNASLTRNPLLRLVPNFIKRPVMFAGFNLTGEYKQTTPMSNLGRLDLPEEITDQIDGIELLIDPSPLMKINCTLLSDPQNLHLFFTSDSKATDVQREFFRFLTGQGARVRVESNIKEEEGETQ